MGFFGSVGSFLSSTVSSVASSLSRAASGAWNSAKEYAGKAVGWLAEKAENFVGSIKGVWQAVKPFVGMIRAGLKTAAGWAANAGMPWLSAALIALDQGIGALTAFENSPIAKKINAAINWSIKLAKRWQNRKTQKSENEYANEILTSQELEEARVHQSNLRSAEREVIPDAQRHQLELLSALNDFEIANADLKNALDGTPENFEHYLRLRATQKLMNVAENKFRTAKTMDELSVDDLFLVQIASNLTKPTPELSNAAAERLNRLLKERHGKTIVTFVYEEMVVSWTVRAKKMQTEWEADNRVLSREVTDLKRLELIEKTQDNNVDPVEKERLAELRKSVPDRKAQLDGLAEEQRDIERYANAAEGFLQVLEKTAEELENEDRGYLKDDAMVVGDLIIKLAQEYKPFKSLDADERAIINNYSNIFRKESKARVFSILEVVV